MTGAHWSDSMDCSHRIQHPHAVFSILRRKGELSMPRDDPSQLHPHSAVGIAFRRIQFFGSAVFMLQNQLIPVNIQRTLSETDVKIILAAGQERGVAEHSGSAAGIVEHG
mgnify:CR=1 FL=1